MGPETVQESHRPGLLKQQNKPHKHGRHRSKRAIDRAFKGRVGIKSLSKKVKREMSKEERRHQAVQLRKNKRNEVLMKKRSLGTATSPPFIVAIVPLSHDIDPYGTVALLKQADPEGYVEESPEGYVHISVPRFRQRFTIAVPASGDLYGILDTLKVADTVMFLLSATTDKGIDAQGEIILTACMAQGLPTMVAAVTHLGSIPPKKRHDAKVLLQKAINHWLPDSKMISLEKHSDVLTALRLVGAQKQRSIGYRDKRPHLLAEEAVFDPSSEGPLGTLKLSGYIRSVPLSVNSLLHIPGWGDFQMIKITAPEDPFPLSLLAKQDISTNKERDLVEADPAVQESLESENIPDAMEGEQTWPTEEEIREAEEDQQKPRKIVKRIPKGMSEYHAAWIPDCDAEEISGDEGKSDGESEAMEAKSGSESEHNNSDGEEYETITVSEFGGDAQNYDEKMDLTEEEEALKKIKDARSDELYPDEIDTPFETPARIRFQKYRGLQSFRTSPWDPKENLPVEYARIFQFQNFNRTRKRVLKNMEYEDGVLPGWYVTLHLKNVPKNLFEARNKTHPLIVYGMLPHEQKMSIVNIVMKRPNVTSSNQGPIESKEQLIFHCGYRRFKACPIFSEHTKGGKHKYERYYRPDSTVVATVFAPVTFPPCPTLVFKQRRNGFQDLVATGTVLSVNPDRIVAKRVVLSGHPFKMYKRISVIRFMFFNKEDIDWFKPIELKAKSGRRGHIKESLGTHGHMKCVFDGHLRADDSVFMCLYKRVFPKWTYEICLDSPQSLYNNLSHDINME